MNNNRSGPHCKICGVVGDCTDGSMILLMWHNHLSGCAGTGLYLCPIHYEELKLIINQLEAESLAKN